jgi:hypothetical protein
VTIQATSEVLEQHHAEVVPNSDGVTLVCICGWWRDFARGEPSSPFVLAVAWMGHLPPPSDNVPQPEEA